MADAIAEAYVRLRPKADGFKAETKGLLGGMNLGSGFKGAAGVTLGVTSVVGALSLLKTGIQGVVMAGAAFETEMNTFQAVTGASADAMERAGALAKKLGQDVKLPSVSAADAAVAMTELAKGGLSVADSLAGVRGALELGTAANTDFGTSAQIIARNLAAFQLSGKEASRVADLLAGASIAATGDVNDMAIALSQSAAVAHGAGISIQDTVTAIAQLAKAGLTGSDAGTSLRTFMLRLIPTTNKAAGVMKNLGIKVLDARGSLLAFPQIIDNYRKALLPLSQAQRQMALNTIFGQDAIRSSTIFALGGAKAFAETAKITTKLGQANVLTTARTKGLAGSLGALHSNLETIGISIAQKVNPSIKRFVDFVNRGLSALPTFGAALRKAFDASAFKNAKIGDVKTTVRVEGIERAKALFQSLTPTVKVATVAITGVTVALIAMAAAAFPISATVLAIAGLAVGFKLAYDRSAQVRAAVDRVKEAVVSAAPVWEQFRATVTNAVDGIRDTVQAAARYITAVWSVVGHRVTIIVRASFGAALDHIRNALKTIQGAIDVFVGVFTGDWRRAWGGLKTIVKAGLDDVTGTVKFWGSSILGIFEGVWKSIEEESLRGVGKVLSVIAKIPTQFSIFGHKIGFANPAKAALESIQEALAGISTKREAKELASAVTNNTAAALAAKTRDLTAAVELPVKKAVKDGAARATRTTQDAGAHIGNTFAKAVDTGIGDSATESIRNLQQRLRDAIIETSVKVKEAVLAAQNNLASIGQGLGADIDRVIEEGPLGVLVKRLQDQLAGRQGRAQSKQLRQAILDSKNALASAQGKRLPGVRPDAQATSLRAALAAARKELAAAQGAFNAAPVTKAQHAEVAKFLKPQTDAVRQAQNALGDFIRNQRTTLKGAQAGFRDFTDQTLITGLQERAAGQKKAVQKRLSTIVDDFNSGAIDLPVFTERITALLEGRAGEFKVAGKTLGIVFARGFNEQVAGLLLQAQALQKSRDKGVPGFLGQGGAPEVTNPLTVLNDQKKIQQGILDELRRTRLRAEKAAAKAATKAAAKKKGGGIDLAALTVGSTG